MLFKKKKIPIPEPLRNCRRQLRKGSAGPAASHEIILPIKKGSDHLADPFLYIKKLNTI